MTKVLSNFKRHIVSVLLILLCGVTKAQDPHFTQFYASPLFLSPSFTGGVLGYRTVANYRNQWSSIPGAYNTYSLSWDHNFIAFKSGLGFVGVRDQAGAGKLGNTKIGVLYSYDFTPSPEWHIRPGLGFYLQQLSIDYSKLIFGDQLFSDAPSATQPGNKGVWDIDVATSILGYSDNAWLGATWDHMLKPVASLYAENDRTPYKFSLFGGYRYITRGFLMSRIEESITFAFNFRVQDIYRQLDLGMYWYSEPFSFGFWWRGMPKSSSTRRIDALAFMVGYKWEQFKVGYSYDFTISNLGLGSGGSHEVSLVYEFKMKTRRRWKALPCPSF
ncbi:MAG: PorP/SprF family type IX secretion system membrane protein [Bacteroidales bacterium]|nr:PorP/SprF family type IX secretion system membrane protein [Bacteroidales bacterium]